MMGAIVGFYDGILGPGTGSFLTMGFVALFGLGVTRAAGHTKLLNLASNLGALTLFIPSGDVMWSAAAAMAVGQVVGGYLGARSGIRFGVQADPATGRGGVAGACGAGAARSLEADARFREMLKTGG